MSTDSRISPKQLAAAGWRSLPRTPGIFGRDYAHVDGWKIQHCGHPTALWPYLLIDPAGEIVLMGAAGPLQNPTYGTAWSSVKQAVEYVANVGKTYRQLLKICRWTTKENTQ